MNVACLLDKRNVNLIKFSFSIMFNGFSVICEEIRILSHIILFSDTQFFIINPLKVKNFFNEVKMVALLKTYLASNICKNLTDMLLNVFPILYINYSEKMKNFKRESVCIYCFKVCQNFLHSRLFFNSKF